MVLTKRRLTNSGAKKRGCGVGRRFEQNITPRGARPSPRAMPAFVADPPGHLAASITHGAADFGATCDLIRRHRRAAPAAARGRVSQVTQRQGVPVALACRCERGTHRRRVGCRRAAPRSAARSSARATSWTSTVPAPPARARQLPRSPCHRKCQKQGATSGPEAGGPGHGTYRCSATRRALVCSRSRQPHVAPRGSKCC